MDIDTAISVGMFCLCFLAFMLIGFDQFFIAFHGLFFNNDAWLFNPLTDPIINALPEAYFCFILFLFIRRPVFDRYFNRKTFFKK